MKIPYRTLDEYKPVDLAKLRPCGSYKQLMAKRTHTIDGLVKKFGRIPDDLLHERPCPSCGSCDASLELEKDYLCLTRCASCDLVYTNPVFDEKHYDEAYRSADYQAIVRDLGEASHDYRVERFGLERVEAMARHLPEGLSAPGYLDVGCSTGFVVEAAKRKGWEAKGIDLNPSAVAFGTARGLDLEPVALEDVSVPTASLDAVSLYDVLEHLIEPARTLERAGALLKEGGIVSLYVPNYESASRILMGKDAHFIWPTHHLTYFTPKTVSDFLARRGFEVVSLMTEGLDMEDYLWRMEDMGLSAPELRKIADNLQFFINAGGYGKNLRVIARKIAKKQ